MSRILLSFVSALAIVFAFLPTAFADTNIGYVIYNITSPPGEAEFDIANLSGAGFLAPDFPVTTAVGLTNLTLTVTFASGPNEIFGASYFSLAPDGLSLNGTALSINTAQPNGLFGATSATLTGTFLTTLLTLSDGTTVSINPNFSTTIVGTDTGGLIQDFDNSVISASPGGIGPSPVPEPESLLLVGTGLTGLATLRRRFLAAAARKALARRSSCAAFALVFALLAAAPAAFCQTQVKISTYTTPTTGAAGSTYVSITGSGFPTGGITPALVTVSLSPTCGGSASATTTATAFRSIIGSVGILQFQVPALLPTGNFFASIAGNSTSGTSFVSGTCSEVSVTHTTTALAACLPSSSLGVLSGTNVTAYVPQGYWEGGATGIKVVPIEGSAVSSTIATPVPVNSCSSNSQTGQTVCVSNSTDVYEITGNTLNTTLQSGSNNFASFSGGSCRNCGVAINALTNTAVISMGVTGGASGDGIQTLNLVNNSFNLATPTNASVSEDVSVDPNRNLILSPGEDSIYDIFKISPTGLLTEYEQYVPGAGEFDSAAEDCTTGIALASLEFTGNLYISDLTQATFTDPVAGAKFGTWTAPGKVVNFPEFAGFSAGTDGISVAAGTTHLGIVSGEFGGSSFGAFQLPATSGVGTPSFVDYVAANMPTDPAGRAFSSGFDPHTITAYTSPNNGKAYGLIADWATGKPTYIGVIDLQALLNAPRTPGTHNVLPSYNLLTNGVVRYVAAP